jgi:hypothetical protein
MRESQIKEFIHTFNPSPGNTFLLAFCWALVGGLLLQFVVLPALPNLHAGHGLLLGGDWTGFHAMGEELALQMALDGWGAWELRYLGNAPSGMLAALYFVFGIHEPWVFLPINALLFGAATFMLHKIFKLVVTDRHSFFAILPFMMFPSALMIYGQVHKDIFSITGTFFIIFVWADLAGRTTLTWRKMLLRIATILAGLVLVWIVRPYFLQSLLLVSFFAALLLSLWVGRRGYKSLWYALTIFLSIQIAATTYGVNSHVIQFSSLQPAKNLISSELDLDSLGNDELQILYLDLTQNSSQVNSSRVEIKRLINLIREQSTPSVSQNLDLTQNSSQVNSSRVEIKRLNNLIREQSTPSVSQNLDLTQNSSQVNSGRNGSIVPLAPPISFWDKSTYPFDRVSIIMSQMRNGFASNILAGSNVDIEVRFTSIEDLLLYIPRALQIGLLAPFPSMWLGQAINRGGGAMRVLSGIEMMFTYVFLVGFLGLLAYGKERWATILLAAGMALALTLLLALVIPNIGTLYRMRYANCALLNGLGILGWGLWFQARSQMKYE